MTDNTSAEQIQATGQDTALKQMATRHLAAKAQELSDFSSALRHAFGRMCAEFPGLDGVVQNITIRDASLPEVLDLAEPGMFLALLEGQGDRMGLLMASPAVLGGMIEAQTTGSVDAVPPPLRKPTQTDAAMMAPMIDVFLRLAEQRCTTLPQAAQIAGYAYGSFLDDPRPLGLMLEETDFCIMNFRVSLGYGAKSGDWIVIVPRPAVSHPSRAEDATRSKADEEWQDRIEVVVAESSVTLEAVLCRVQLTLSEALRLRPGDVLRVPETSLEMLSLESIDQTALCIARLGQARAQRALRLTADPGCLTDETGGQLLQAALPASVIPFHPPHPSFAPETEASASDNDPQGADSGLPVESSAQYSTIGDEPM